VEWWQNRGQPSTSPRPVGVIAERAIWGYDGFSEWGFIRIVE